MYYLCQDIMQIPQYISHIRKSADGNIIALQSNEKHCIGVAELAKQFASEIAMGEFGWIMGMLHDKGKEKKEFQNYIRYANGLAEKKNYTQEGKAHAYVGGLLAKALGPMVAPLIENAIMGHHRGLYDYPDLEAEEQRSIPEEIDAPDINKPTLPTWFKPGNLLPRV